MKAVHVAASPLDIVPSEVMRLLATEDGRTFGYGYGPGWSLMFGSEHGDVTVLPGQWVIRHDDGTVTVQDHEPTVRCPGCDCDPVGYAPHNGKGDCPPIHAKDHVDGGLR